MKRRERNALALARVPEMPRAAPARPARRRVPSPCSRSPASSAAAARCHRRAARSARALLAGRDPRARSNRDRRRRCPCCGRNRDSCRTPARSRTCTRTACRSTCRSTHPNRGAGRGTSASACTADRSFRRCSPARRAAACASRRPCLSSGPVLSPRPKYWSCASRTMAVHDARRALPGGVRVGRTIGAARDPTAADGLLPRDAEGREADHGAQAVCRQRDDVAAVVALASAGGETVESDALASRPRDFIDSGCDRPGPRLAQAIRRMPQHPAEPRFQQPHFAPPAALEREHGACRCAAFRLWPVAVESSCASPQTTRPGLVRCEQVAGRRRQRDRDRGAGAYGRLTIDMRRGARTVDIAHRTVQEAVAAEVLHLFHAHRHGARVLACRDSQVLRTDAQNQCLPGRHCEHRAATARSCRRPEAAGKCRLRRRTPRDTGTKFICGEPMKPATNLLAGLL